MKSYWYGVIILGSILIFSGCALRQAVSEKPSLFPSGRAMEVPRPPLPVLARPAMPEAGKPGPAREEIPAPAVREEVITRRPEEAPVRMEPVAPTREGVSPLDDIHFDFDKYNLKERAKRVLLENFRWLTSNPQAKIEIQGHADERGSDEYNLALGERRADTARLYLQTLGVDPARMTTVSYGEFRPVDPGHTEEAYAKNRRDHFTIISK
jgi:peptidoglycan-associated lipoprotein